jgi:hypothetical protein
VLDGVSLVLVSIAVLFWDIAPTAEGFSGVPADFGSATFAVSGVPGAVVVAFYAVAAAAMP